MSYLILHERKYVRNGEKVEITHFILKPEAMVLWKRLIAYPYVVADNGPVIQGFVRERVVFRVKNNAINYRNDEINSNVPVAINCEQKFMLGCVLNTLYAAIIFFDMQLS